MHAASVGEAFMALPVMQQVRRALPRVQIAYTFFSPSAEAGAAAMPADFADYLPFDTATSMRAALDALAPAVLVFTKADVWPVLTREASARGIRLGLISASVPAASKRTHGLASTLTSAAYASLDIIGAASSEDVAQLSLAGARTDHVRVAGDTRYDQAWARAHSTPSNTELVDALRNDRATLVAGSTWPVDEHELLPAWLRLRAEVPHARIIIVPHEPRDAHVASLHRWAAAHHLTAARIGEPPASEADVVIVNRTGVLADVYGIATIAYVGGGFHAAGLHSVVEPAVFRVPTIIGPRHAASRDARLMLAAGGLATATDADSMHGILLRLFTNPGERAAMSDALGGVVSAELGATERSFEIIRELLGPM